MHRCSSQEVSSQIRCAAGALSLHMRAYNSANELDDTKSRFASLQVRMMSHNAGQLPTNARFSRPRERTPTTPSHGRPAPGTGHRNWAPLQSPDPRIRSRTALACGCEEMVDNMQELAEEV